MKRIICYCSGGLGNRLKPIASCWTIANMTGRDLVIVWEPTLRCMAPFDSLFYNTNLKLLPQTQLPNLALNTRVYCPDDAASYESKLNNVTGLLRLVELIGSRPLDTRAILRDSTENIVVFSNTFLPDISIQAHQDIFLYYLKINKDILNKVDEFWKSSGLTKDAVGVHARGTDFEDSGINADYYLNRMSVLSNWSFFLCSDSSEYENYIKEKDGRNVITRPKTSYVSKHINGAWSNNVLTPTESVQEALVDLLLLARTNFRIYHPNSSFAHLVEYFKGYYIEPYVAP